MKNLVLALFATTLVSSVSFAQNRRPETAVIKTPNVRCWTCVERLEEYMAQEISQTESGIIKMKINALSGTTTVQFYPDRTSLDYIRTAFANAGFDADSIKATPDSYKLLPPACKRNEEGGGPQKGKPCHQKPM